MKTAEEQQNPNRSLTQNQIDTFRREGYLSIGKLIADSELEELRSEYDRAFNEARESAQYRNLSADGGAPVCRPAPGPGPAGSRDRPAGTWRNPDSD